MHVLRQIYPRFWCPLPGSVV